MDYSVNFYLSYLSLSLGDSISCFTGDGKLWIKPTVKKHQGHCYRTVHVPYLKLSTSSLPYII